MKRLTTTISLTIALLLGNGGSALALPECEYVYRHNCFGTYTAANGDTLVGVWRNDKIHGKGANFLASGDKYVGEFRNGKRNGQGTYT